ncbi:ATP-binding protein [Streptomyces sp. NPDC002787]
MKQSAAKTLGVAVVGAAIAAAGAGAANAAPSAPDAAQAVGTAAHALPVENVSQTLPPASGAVTEGQRALGAGLEAVQPTVTDPLAGDPTAPATGLLGGLPTGKTLPAKGDLGVNGLPLGGPTA